MAIAKKTDTQLAETYRKRAVCISNLSNKVLVTYGMKQVELAKELGVHSATFSSWVRGASAPNAQGEFERVRAELRILLAKISTEPAPQKQEPKKMKLTDLMPNPPPAPVVQALEVQVGGSHYKDCSIQPLEFIEANSLGFLEGCIVKRLTRHDKATGKGAQDIHKVIHEAQLLLELRYPQEVQA